MRDELVKELLTKVKKDYSEISKRFSETRKNPWDEFGYFARYLAPGMTVLDLGCGNGRLFSFLKEKKINYLGIDNNEKLLQLARERHPQAKFQHGEQYDIPLPDESIDQVWNIAAFHHVPSRALRRKVLHEMKRVLKKNGILILTVWNLWQKKYRKYVIKSIITNLIFGEYEYNDTFIPWGKENLVLRYYHAFRAPELDKLLKDTGWKILDHFCSRKGELVDCHSGFNICFVAKKQ